MHFESMERLHVHSQIKESQKMLSMFRLHDEGHF